MRDFLVEEPNYAQIAGTFNNWQPESYEKAYLIKTEESKIQFKFIDSNGNWTTSQNFKTCEDNGNLNNYYEFEQVAQVQNEETKEEQTEKIPTENVVEKAFEPESKVVEVVANAEPVQEAIAPVHVQTFKIPVADEVVIPQVPIAVLEALTLEAAANVTETESPACPPNSPVSVLDVQEETLKTQISANTISVEPVPAEKTVPADEEIDDLPLERTHTMEEPKLQKKQSFFKKMIGKMFSKKKQAI